MTTNSIATTPAPAQTNANNNGTDGSNSQSNRNRRRNNQPNQVQLTNPITFEGDTPEFGCVIGMRHEKFNKKVPFETFLDNMNNYAISTLKDGASLQPLFLDKKDPVIAFNTDNKPVALETTADKVDKEFF